MLRKKKKRGGRKKAHAQAGVAGRVRGSPRRDSRLSAEPHEGLDLSTLRS